MDLKNTAILLIFLLCILGLITGIYCTQSSEPVKDIKDYDEIIHIADDGSITIHLEKKENESNFINKLFT